MRSMDEEKERERLEMVRNLVRSKLQETGDLDRLRCFVRRRLATSGWKNNMLKELKVVVNEKGVNNVTVQDLYNRIDVIGQNIDEQVEQDALRKIKYCYKEAISEKDGRDVEHMSDVNANNSMGKMRYRHDRRK